MSFDYVAKQAAKQHDVLFNLVSLKVKFLIKEKVCQNCQQTTNNWIFMNICQHTVCPQCISESTCCPICKTVFDYNNDIQTYEKMEKAHNQMEKLIWTMLAMERGTLDGIPPPPAHKKKYYFKINENNFSIPQDKESKGVESLNFNKKDPPSDKSIPSKTNCTLSEFSSQTLNKSSLIEKKSNISIGLSRMSKQNGSVSKKGDVSCKVLDQIEFKSNHLDTGNICEPSNTFVPRCLNYNEKEVIKSFKPKGLEIQTQTHNMSVHSHPDKSNRDDSESLNNNSSSSSESEKDVIAGTPQRLNILKPDNSKKQNILLTYSNLTTDDVNYLNKMLELFDHVKVCHEWNDEVTHLVLNVDDTGCCKRTIKFLNALLSNSIIVKFEWVINCITSKSLLPVIDYLPLEMGGEPSPLMSYRVGQDMIDSPLNWTKNCALYFNYSVHLNDSFSDLIDLAKKAGFVLVDEVKKLSDDNYNVRVILIDSDDDDDLKGSLLTPENIKYCLCNYNAVTLYLDWFLECLSKYKFVKIESRFQVMKLPLSFKPFTKMDESCIEFCE